MFNINKWVYGLDFRRLPGPVFDPPKELFRRIGGGGGGFCLISDGQEISTIEWQELKNRFPSFFVHK